MKDKINHANSYELIYTSSNDDHSIEPRSLFEVDSLIIGKSRRIELLPDEFCPSKRLISLILISKESFIHLRFLTLIESILFIYFEIMVNKNKSINKLSNN